MLTVKCISRLSEPVRLALRYTTVDVHYNLEIGDTSETVELMSANELWSRQAVV